MLMGHGGHSFFINESFHGVQTEKMDLGFSVSPSYDISSSSTSTSSATSNNYIEHTVSKMDTLAGIAIKYGVEVSDIKRMNGLMTDLQMFAHKTLHIPLPGRHPPSTALSNSPKTPSSVSSRLPPRYGIRSSYRNNASDSTNVSKTKKSEKRPVSLAMSLLRGYYGLSPSQEGNEGTEMKVYRTDNGLHTEGEPFTPSQTYANGGPQAVNKTSNVFLNGDLLKKAEKGARGEGSLRTDDDLLFKEVLVTDSSCNEIEKASESSVRRRTKVEGMDSSNSPSENVLKQESSYTAKGGKGLSLRPKTGGKFSMTSDATSALEHQFTISDPFMADAFITGVGSLRGLGESPGNGKPAEDFISKVRRSSSTPSLQDSGRVSPIKSGSRWQTKGDIQGVSTSSVPRPIFEGIARPLNGRRNKAAMD